MKTHSWVIIEKSTGIAVLETYQEDIARKINLEKFKVVPILEYLRSLNKQRKDR